MSRDARSSKFERSADYGARLQGDFGWSPYVPHAWECQAAYRWVAGRSVYAFDE